LTRSEIAAPGTTSTHLDVTSTTPILSLPLMPAALAKVEPPTSLMMMAAPTKEESIASVTLASGMMTGHPDVETTTPASGLHRMLAALVEEEPMALERSGSNPTAPNGRPWVILPEMAVIGTPPTQAIVQDIGILQTFTPQTAAPVVAVPGKMTFLKILLILFVDAK
jgi:hypothetical protein